MPTRTRRIVDQRQAREQIEELEANVARYAIPYLALDSAGQGVVHVVGPETGVTLPGTTMLCSDSHTTTHRAFATLAFGVGASECGTVIAARMTLRNMAIEAGGRIGLIAPGATTFSFVEGRAMAPKGEAWRRAVAFWQTLANDDDAVFDREIAFDLSTVAPHLTWETSPDEAPPITETVPDPSIIVDVGAHRHTAESGIEFTVDLETSPLSFANMATAFTMPEHRRQALLNGWDDTATILNTRASKVAAFEARHAVIHRWLFDEEPV